MSYGADILSAIKQPTFKSPVEVASQGLQLQNAVQQNQAGQLENQQRQAALAEAQRKAALHPFIEQALMGSIDKDGNIDWKAAANKIGAKDPELAQTWLTHAQTMATSAASAKNFESEATTRAGTLAETQRHNQVEEVPAQEREFQAFYPSYLASRGVEKNAFYEAKARQAFKVQGSKVTPGESVLGADATPVFTAPQKPEKPTDTERYAQLYTKTQQGQATPEEQLEFKGLKERATLSGTNTFNLQQGAVDPRLANVPPNVHKDVLDKVQKAEDDFTSAQQAADDMQTFISMAKSGNKIAYSYAPTEGVLTFNTGRGVKRVNMAEIQSYSGAGSLVDRIKGYLGKQASGASIPADVLNDMASIHQAVAQNAQTARDRKLQTIDKTYRSNFTGSAAGGTGPAAAGHADPLGIR